jgi:hypothetical protein
VLSLQGTCPRTRWAGSAHVASDTAYTGHLEPYRKRGEGLQGITGSDWILRWPRRVCHHLRLVLARGRRGHAHPAWRSSSSLAGWPHGASVSLREKEFVEAARSLGASDTRIIFRHILPNLVAPIIVYTTLLVPTVILFEAALSFLGIGVQPPTASWGAMIADAIEIFDTAWWYMTFPGVALLLTVLAFNLVGDGLQDALNPRTGR